MTDHELLRAFEACSLSENDFHHPQHVRVAWLYLGQESLLEALKRFTANLRRFAASKGKPDRYHETITWAYVILTHQRMQQLPSGDWEDFARRNADLLTWRPSLLDHYYRPETLSSPLARSVFLLPDKVYEALR